MSRKSISAVGLALILALGAPLGALAQCGGNSGYMHDQHMGASGHMGSGQMGMYGQAPVQPDPNAVTPGYVAPAPPVSGYTVPQDNSGSGQTMGQTMSQTGAGSGHSGHMGH